MSREAKAMAVSVLGAGIAAVLGFLALNLIVWSCGESTQEQPECLTVEDCPEAGTCMQAVCRSHTCGVEPRTDFPACNTGSAGEGICLDGQCRTDVCLFEHESFSRIVLSGEFDPDDGCHVCDPAQSRSAWSAFECQQEVAAPCLTEPVCDGARLAGACAGQDCCAGEPIWDGTGTAPSCALPGGGQGVCTTAGECAGCQSAADCDDGRECVEYVCNASAVCEFLSAADGTTCQYLAGPGVCEEGRCFQVCNGSGECSANQYCTDLGRCHDKLPIGTGCGDDEECVSGFCTPAFEEDLVDQRCTAADCTVCERASDRGTCDSLPDGSAAGCTGECGGGGPYPAEGSWSCCAGTCLCVETGGSCP